MSRLLVQDRLNESVADMVKEQATLFWTPFLGERVVGRAYLSPRLLDSLEIIPRTGTGKKRGGLDRDLRPGFLGMRSWLCRLPTFPRLFRSGQIIEKKRVEAG